LLTESEAGGIAASLAPKDTFVIWSEGTQSTATLRSVSAYHPGDYREMPLTLEAPVTGMEGSRILLVRGERVVGLGAITQIRQ
jgi:translation elongation factor EF-Tu-like GTPase